MAREQEEPGKRGNAKKEFEENMKPQKDRPIPVKKQKKKRKKWPLFLLLALLLSVATFVSVRMGLLEKSGLIQLPETPSDGAQASSASAASDPVSSQKFPSDISAGMSPGSETTQRDDTSLVGNEQTFEEMQANLSEEKIENLKKVGTIYSKMDPTAAAEIMTEIYQPMEIAAIVYYMQPAASAALLEKMTAQLSAEVTQLLLT